MRAHDALLFTKILKDHNLNQDIPIQTTWFDSSFASSLPDEQFDALTALIIDACNLESTDPPHFQQTLKRRFKEDLVFFQRQLDSCVRNMLDGVYASDSKQNSSSDDSSDDDSEDEIEPNKEGELQDDDNEQENGDDDEDEDEEEEDDEEEKTFIEVPDNLKKQVLNPPHDSDEEIEENDESRSNDPAGQIQNKKRKTNSFIEATSAATVTHTTRTRSQKNNKSTAFSTRKSPRRKK